MKIIQQIFNKFFPLEDSSNASPLDRELVNKIITDLQNNPLTWKGTSERAYIKVLTKKNIKVSIRQLPSSGAQSRRYHSVHFHINRNLLCYFTLREDTEIVRVICKVLKQEEKKYMEELSNQLNESLK
jgi:hypothetical protein